jgi:hypothetical protein
MAEVARGRYGTRIVRLILVAAAVCAVVAPVTFGGSAFKNGVYRARNPATGSPKVLGYVVVKSGKVVSAGLQSRSRSFTTICSFGYSLGLTGPRPATVKGDGRFSFYANKARVPNGTSSHTIPAKAHVWGRFRVVGRRIESGSYKATLRYRVVAQECTRVATFTNASWDSNS